ncbi:MAG: hypothetical protein JW876_10415 [Candidatus Krumholzibacteriota bacterium]|nr:hypothetical protein [Candidatus Krumholzibacteriota bacterium]
MKKRRLLFLTALAAVLIHGTAGAQVFQAVMLERFGIMDPTRTGARPFALGGAYTAVSDDVFGLVYNPAGLVQVDRNAFSIGIHHVSVDIDNAYGGLRSAQGGSYTSLGHLAGVFPYEEMDNNIVLGVGVFRAGTGDLEWIKSGLWSGGAMSMNRYMQSGTIYQYRFGIGVDLSPAVALGAALVVWEQSLDIVDEIRYEDTDSIALYTDDVEVDLDGVSLEFGVMFFPHEALQAGVTVSSPAWLSYDGDGVVDYSGTYKSGPYVGWESDPAWGIIEEDYTLPMRFRGGLALVTDLVLVTADVEYVDWTQTKYEGQRLDDEFAPGRDVLDDVWNLCFGAEIRLPWPAMSFRGGYSYAPLVTRSIDEISLIVDDAPESIVADYEIGTDRHLFTFGIGAVVDRVFLIDAAVAFGGFDRDTGEFSEKRDITEIVVSGGYRF